MVELQKSVWFSHVWSLWPFCKLAVRHRPNEKTEGNNSVEHKVCYRKFFFSILLTVKPGNGFEKAFSDW